MNPIKSDLIIYLTELETMTKQLVEGLQGKLATDHLDEYEEGYLEGKIIEKQRLLFIIKDLKSLFNTEQREQINYNQIIQGIIDADEREMW